MLYGTAIVTADQIATISSAATENLAVIIPAGLALMAIMLGVKLIPKVIYKFFR